MGPSCRKMVSSFTESHCAESTAAATAAAAAAHELMAPAEVLTKRSSRLAWGDASRSRRGHQCPGYIKPQNLTRVSEFFLLGLSDDLELQPLLLGLFLSMYLVAVLGNMLIILTVSSDSHLHTPMYFFLCNLSLADICFISTTSKDNCGHPDSQQSHLLWGMPDTDVFFDSFWTYG
ncbi:hypothetical protein QTO34_015573 [Cnephaeus nilssonii]|uniref:G-protein coupled receptors family 1 profile domain-containing protein n=1 Tax=Cnephaeus nilssonii TaxID=3371016 RepID=A0AA40I4J7_CNENI|nr:hypothetical protein QTO34_015573 [Eptesicus nilssonii]